MVVVVVGEGSEPFGPVFGTAVGTPLGSGQLRQDRISDYSRTVVVGNRAFVVMDPHIVVAEPLVTTVVSVGSCGQPVDYNRDKSNQRVPLDPSDQSDVGLLVVAVQCFGHFYGGAKSAVPCWDP